MPASESPTVERFVVVSNRDDAGVVGPLESRKLADDECDRLNREQFRNWITGGETQPGEAIQPPGYRVEAIDVLDTAATVAAFESELGELAKMKPPEGYTAQQWKGVVRTRRESLEAEKESLDAG